MPIPSVIIDFAVAGMQNVERAFASVETRMVRMEQGATQAQERGSKTRVRGAQSEADQREKAYNKLVREIERDEAKAVKDFERAADKKLKEGERAAKKRADAEISEAERSRKAQEREAERLEAYKQRLRARAGDEARRYAMQEAREEAIAHNRAQNKFASGLGRAGKTAFGSVGGLMGSAASMAGMALTIGGGFALADVTRNAMSAQGTAGLIRNVVTVGNNGVSPEGASVANLVGRASQASRETGMDRGDILQGALEYARKAKGGDIQGVVGNMNFFAKMAKVTGASITDIAGAAGTLQSQNQGLGVKDMQQMLLDVFAQSGKGSLGMVDIAKQLGVMASARGSFAGDVSTNQRKLLALGQLAAPEGSPEEAGTFVKDLVMEAGKHRKSTSQTVGLEQMGVKYDKFGRMDSPEQMIESVFRGTGGDITKIEKLFGARGKAVFGALLNPYTAAGGGEAGIAAVRNTMAGVTGAQSSPEALDKQVGEMLAEPGEKFKRALNELSLHMEDKILPWLPKFAEDLEKMIPALEGMMDKGAKLAEWFVDNPITGIGAIIIGTIAKDLAAANVGTAIAAMIKGILAGQAGAGGVLTGGAGSAAGFGAAGATIASGAAGVAAGYLLSNQLASNVASSSQQAVSTNIVGSNVANALTGEARSGTVTPADIAAGQQTMSKLQKEREKEQGELSYRNATSWLYGADGGKALVSKAANELKLTDDTINSLSKAMAAAVASTRVASNTGPSNPANSLPIDQRPSH